MPQIFSAGTINARRRIVSDLLETGATTPEQAIPFEPKNGAEAEYFHALRKSDALKLTAQGKTYLNVENFENYLSSRNRRIVGLLGGAMAGLFGLLLVGRS